MTIRNQKISMKKQALYGESNYEAICNILKAIIESGRSMMDFPEAARLVTNG